MNSSDVKFLLFHIAIPFAIGSGLGSVFMCSIYPMDIGGMRSLLTANGGSIFDLGLVPIACAFGSLAIGTLDILFDD